MRNDFRGPGNASPEERLLRLLQDNLTLSEKIAEAQQLREEGESLEAILKVYPECSEVFEKESRTR